MTEARIATLLVCLRDYYREHEAILPSPLSLTVSELAGDLLDLLPVGCERISGLDILEPRPLLSRTAPPEPMPGQVDIEGNIA